jgi:hypothetical protein
VTTSPEPDLRARSKQLFGNSYMLEVCIEVGRADGRFCLSTLAHARTLEPSLYSRPIARLSSLGLLVPAASVEGDDHRSRWYDAAESLLWQTVTEFER